MIKYVIFGWAAGIAGGQLYTDAKCNVLEKKGYEVYVIYGQKGAVVLPSILKAKTIYIPQINCFPSDFLLTKIMRIINGITKVIDARETDLVYIESSGVMFSYWAELVAYKLNAKHFANYLEGYFDYSKHNNKKFLLFKLNRKEIAGSRESSLYHLLGKEYINSNNNRYFYAYLTPSVAEVPSKMSIQWDAYDYVITYVGRESKPCFESIEKGVLRFFEQYPKLNFLFLCIGCRTDGSIYHAVQNDFSDHPNASLYFTDPLFPIPQELIKNSDVCIGSSGSALIAATHNNKTILFSDNGTFPLGVIGYDEKTVADETRYYYNDLSCLIEEILFRGYCEEKSYSFFGEHIDDTTRENSILHDIQEMMSLNERGYYNTLKIRRKGFKGLLEKYYFKIYHFIKTD